MNFYSFHLGDYAKHTKHLSLMEDLAYRRMLDLYYVTEQSLPLDIQRIARKIGMIDATESIKAILEDFFTEQPDGWHQSRCDEEIGAFQEKSEKAKKSADKRWSKSSGECQRNANAMPSHSEGNAKMTNGNAPTPTPTPTPNKSFSAKKKKTQFPDGFELTPERKAKAETYWGKHGVSLDAQRVFDNFQSSHKAKGTMMVDWESAWVTWYGKAIDYAATGTNGTGKSGKQIGCVMRIQLEEFRFGNCGKPSAGEVRGKILCKEHLAEVKVGA